MPLSRLSQWWVNITLIYVIILLHDLMQMDFVLQELIKLKPFERLEHLLDHFLNILDQTFVFDFYGLLCN